MGRGKKRRDINKAAPSKSQLMLAFPALQKLWQSYHPSIGWPSSDRKWSLALFNFLVGVDSFVGAVVSLLPPVHFEPHTKAVCNCMYLACRG